MSKEGITEKVRPSSFDSQSDYRLNFSVVIWWGVGTKLIPGPKFILGGFDTSRGSGHVELSKVATSTTTITGQATFVGGFDTTYSITGSPWDIKNSKDLIVSSVQDDFGKSSTIGYIKASGTAEGASNMTGLANSFVSNEQINQQIQELLDKSIEAAQTQKRILFKLNAYLEIAWASSHVLNIHLLDKEIFAQYISFFYLTFFLEPITR